LNKKSRTFEGDDVQEMYQEVSEFLLEKEKHIKESIIGSRAMEELEDFSLDVGIKKTYFCTRKDNKKAYPTLAKIIEKFIEVYGGTATIYPKGESICLELITPMRDL
jgi:hypothetical protein